MSEEYYFGYETITQDESVFDVLENWANSNNGYVVRYRDFTTTPRTMHYAIVKDVDIVHTDLKNSDEVSTLKSLRAQRDNIDEKLKSLDHKHFKYIRGEYTDDEWSLIKEKINDLMVERNELDKLRYELSLSMTKKWKSLTNN